MIRFTAIIVAATTSVYSFSTAEASTVNVATDPGQVYISENGIGSSSVSGASLAGMEVTVNYVDGGEETLIWGATTHSAGAASSSDFSLSNQWWDFTLNTTRMLAAFSMSTLGLDAVFDIYPVDYRDTPNSLRGVAFNVVAGDQDGLVDVLFENRVLVRGHMTGEDLYTDMTVDFTGLTAGGFLGSISFVTDLDAFAVSDDLTLVAAPVPAGLPLLLGGLGILGLARRKRR